MMRATTYALACLLLLTRSASAQTPTSNAPGAQFPTAAAFPADARIGFVDLQSVVENSTFGRAGQERLRTLRDQKTAEIGAKNQAALALEQEIQSGQNVLAAGVLQQKTAERDRSRRELQFLQEQAQVDFEALQSQILSAFGDKVMPIVEQIRSERNLWAILSADRAAGLLAAAPALDLTAEVVGRLDAVR